MNIVTATFSELGELLDQEEASEELIWSEAEQMPGGYLYRYETESSYGRFFLNDAEVEKFYQSNKDWVDQEVEESDFIVTPAQMAAKLMGDHEMIFG